MTDKHKSKKELENEGKETVEIFQDLDQTALKTEMFIEKYAKQIGIIFGAVVLIGFRILCLSAIHRKS